MGDQTPLDYSTDLVKVGTGVPKTTTAAGLRAYNLRQQSNN